MSSMTFSTEDDMIDLTAFDLDADDLAGLLRVRGEDNNARVIVDLRAHGGGTIEITGADTNDIDDYDSDDALILDMLDLANADMLPER